MRYKCRTCKQPIEAVVSANGKFFAVDAEPDMTANLALDRSRPVPVAKVMSDKAKQRLLTALDGAPCVFYRAHQCSNKEGNE